jgi:hypothetical protein
MSTWSKSQKIVQVIAFYAVLCVAGSINNHYKDSTSFWLRVIVGSLLTGAAIAAVSLSISRVYKHK